jgi:hypothetical protein
MLSKTGMERIYLPEFPVVFMVDAKLNWEDFKKAIKEVAVDWGFKEWLTTVVLGGKVWKDLEGKHLTEKFNHPKEKEHAEQKVAELHADLRKALGIAERDEEFFQMSVQFIDMVSMDIEGINKAPARHMGLVCQGTGRAKVPPTWAVSLSRLQGGSV